MDKVDRLGWAASCTLQIGDLVVGIRSNTVEVDALIRKVFESWIVHEVDIRPSYSIRIVDPRPAFAGPDNARSRPPARELHTLYRSSSMIARSRSASHLVRALAAHLGRHRPRHESDLLVRVNALALVDSHRATLVPWTYRSLLPQLEPRLRRLGNAVVHEPDAALDPTTGDLVVGASGLEVNEDAMSELDMSFPPREGDQEVPPGRYPLGAWFVRGTSNGDGVADVAHDLAYLVPLIANLDALESQPVLELLAHLHSQIVVQALDAVDVASLVGRLTELTRPPLAASARSAAPR